MGWRHSSVAQHLLGILNIPSDKYCIGCLQQYSSGVCSYPQYPRGTIHLPMLGKTLFDTHDCVHHVSRQTNLSYLPFGISTTEMPNFISFNSNITLLVLVGTLPSQLDTFVLLHHLFTLFLVAV